MVRLRFRKCDVHQRKQWCEAVAAQGKAHIDRRELGQARNVVVSLHAGTAYRGVDFQPVGCASRRATPAPAHRDRERWALGLCRFFGR